MSTTVIRTVTQEDRIYAKIALWLKENLHAPMLDSEFYTYFTPTDGERFEVALADKSYFSPYPNISYHRPCVRGVIQNGELTSIEVIEP